MEGKVRHKNAAAASGAAKKQLPVRAAGVSSSVQRPGKVGKGAAVSLNASAAKGGGINAVKAGKNSAVKVVKVVKVVKAVKAVKVVKPAKVVKPVKVVKPMKGKAEEKRQVSRLDASTGGGSVSTTRTTRVVDSTAAFQSRLRVQAEQARAKSEADARGQSGQSRQSGQSKQGGVPSNVREEGGIFVVGGRGNNGGLTKLTPAATQGGGGRGRSEGERQEAERLFQSLAGEDLGAATGREGGGDAREGGGEAAFVGGLVDVDSRGGSGIEIDECYRSSDGLFIF